MYAAIDTVPVYWGAEQTAECLHTMAMIQKKENPEIGDKALGSQNMALEVRGCFSSDRTLSVVHAENPDTF